MHRQKPAATATAYVSFMAVMLGAETIQALRLEQFYAVPWYGIAFLVYCGGLILIALDHYLD